MLSTISTRNASRVLHEAATRFLLLHEGRNEDAVRFFNDVYDKCVQALNPFYTPDAEITSPSFDRA